MHYYSNCKALNDNLYEDHLVKCCVRHIIVKNLHYIILLPMMPLTWRKTWIWIIHNAIHPWNAGAIVDVKIPSCPYWTSLYKDKTLLLRSYHNNWNLYTRKNSMYNETQLSLLVLSQLNNVNDNVLIDFKYISFHWINSLYPSDALWWHRSGSTLAQAMACCLMAPSHYLNQCWLIISEGLWHSPDFTVSAQATIL